MQLDLFMHSADVGLRNAVVEALRSRDTNAMRVAIDRLRSDFPGDGHLDHFEHLFSTLSTLSRLESSPAGVAEQLERIETQLLPSVRRLLGTDAARRWIEPVYLDLARAIAGKPFSRGLSSTHAAGFYLRAGALGEARAAVVEIPSWRRIPEPLAWMADIALRENSPAEFWPYLAELAWIAPTLFAELLARQDARASTATVVRLYREFGKKAEMDEEDNVSDESDEAAWFPAWLLVEHPELLPFLRTVQHYNSRPARSAALLIDLLIGERQSALPIVADKRKQLRDLAPTLFQHYMARRQ
jgi:hypothetical protein